MMAPFTSSEVLDANAFNPLPLPICPNIPFVVVDLVKAEEEDILLKYF